MNNYHQHEQIGADRTAGGLRGVKLSKNSRRVAPGTIRGEDYSVVDRVDLVRDVEERKKFPSIGNVRMGSWNGLNTAQIRQKTTEQKTTHRRNGLCGTFCSWPCCLFCVLLIAILLCSAFVALLIHFRTPSADTTTTITTRIATVATVTITTVAQMNSTLITTPTTSLMASTMGNMTSTTSVTASTMGNTTSTTSPTASTMGNMTSTTSPTTSTSSSRTSTSSSTTLVTTLTSSSTTSTVSTTTITTTTTSTNCGSSCVNQTWISSSNSLARWLFDASFADESMLRNGTALNSPRFLTGYVNQSVFFNASLNQSMISTHLPLSNTSFTITLWFNVTGYPNLVDHGILGVCSTTLPNQCLFMSIRGNNSNYRLYMSFFGQACQGTIDILVNQWYHVGFVFDMNTMTQSIYLNGEIDQLCPVVSPLTLAASTLTSIGYVPLLAPLTGTNFFHGLIDQLIVNNRVKSACELLEEATLATRFAFDGPATTVDLGPNNLEGSGNLYTLVPSVSTAQAISLQGSNESNFVIERISALGISNQAFSISLWIRPQNLSGAVIHLSSAKDGRDWCMPYMGFNVNGSLFVEILSGGIRPIIMNGLLPVQSWSFIVQTWGPIYGLRLYVNSTLAASNSTLTGYSASGVPMYLFLGSGGAGLFHCSRGALPFRSPFAGAVDDLRVYSRELTVADICTIQNS